jgi:hypothetical protein
MVGPPRPADSSETGGVFPFTTKETTTMIAMLWEMNDGRWKIIAADSSVPGIRNTLDEAREQAKAWGLQVYTIVRLN